MVLQGRMRPGAFLFTVEFEGPFRFQLSELQVRWINLALRLMPRPLRPVPRDDRSPFPAADARKFEHFIRATRTGRHRTVRSHRSLQWPCAEMAITAAIRRYRAERIRWHFAFLYGGTFRLQANKQ